MSNQPCTTRHAPAESTSGDLEKAVMKLQSDVNSHIMAAGSIVGRAVATLDLDPRVEGAEVDSMFFPLNQLLDQAIKRLDELELALSDIDPGNRKISSLSDVEQRDILKAAADTRQAICHAMAIPEFITSTGQATGFGPQELFYPALLLLRHAHERMNTLIRALRCEISSAASGANVCTAGEEMTVAA